MQPESDRTLPISGQGIFGWMCSKIVFYAKPETFLELMVITEEGVCSQDCLRILKSGTQGYEPHSRPER